MIRSKIRTHSENLEVLNFTKDAGKGKRDTAVQLAAKDARYRGEMTIEIEAN